MRIFLLLFYTILSLDTYQWLIKIYRLDFPIFIGGMTLLFLLYGLLYFHIKKYFSDKWLYIIAIGIVFRLMVIPSIPRLSDDFYRFIWDGILSVNGKNPFLYLPKDIILNPDFEAFFPKGLFESLNSPQYFSVYPPVCQAIFALAVWLFPSQIFAQIMVMKFAILLAEIGSLFFLYKLLSKFQLPIYYLSLYALNPLTIIELTGNLHFEAFMIMGILGAVYFLIEKKHISALFFAIAVCAKLLPIMFLPFLYKKLPLNAFIFYLTVVGFCCILMFLPFWDKNTFINILTSTRLYFQSFEFNASIYYVLREIGYLIFGYNLIHILGKILPILVLTGIFYLTKQDFQTQDASFVWLKQIFYALTLYLFCATTVNPWYVVPLLAFTAFVTTRFAVLWSFLLPFTYFAYRNGSCQESLWLVLVEYSSVFLMIFLTIPELLNIDKRIRKNMK